MLAFPEVLGVNAERRLGRECVRLAVAQGVQVDGLVKRDPVHGLDERAPETQVVKRRKAVVPAPAVPADAGEVPHIDVVVLLRGGNLLCLKP